MAITIGVFTFLRLMIGQDLRPRYMSAITNAFSFLHPPPTPTGSYWLVSGRLVGPGGQVVSSPAHSGPTLSLDGVPISINHVPSACRTLVFQDPRKTSSCLTAHGYHGLAAYQPASRYWALQGIRDRYLRGPRCRPHRRHSNRDHPPRRV